MVDAETTATRKLYKSGDGSFIAEVSPKPTRFKDATTGTWRDIDLTLVPGIDGSLGPKAADPSSSAHLSPVGDATVAAFDTSAGPIGMRLPAGVAAPASVRGRTATYKGAVGGNDLTLDLTSDGVEESVVLADARAEPTHTVEFAVPAGVTARDSERGVELVAADGTAIASFGSGLAHDAGPAGGAVAPVSVHVVAPVTPKTVDDRPTPTLAGAQGRGGQGEVGNRTGCRGGRGGPSVAGRPRQEISGHR